MENNHQKQITVKSKLRKKEEHKHKDREIGQ
jgi:hypothetical protein